MVLIFIGWAMKLIPILTSVDIAADTLRMSTSLDAIHFKFIGQGGEVLSVSKGGKQAEYIIKADDHYVRTEILFNDGTTFYLNPVVKYEGDHPQSLKTAKVDQKKTRNLRIIYFIIILSLAYLYARRRQKTRKSSHAK